MLTAIVRWSLGRPRLVAAFALLLLIYGAFVLRSAKFDVFPDFVPAQAEVQTEAPGLDAQQVELLVTRVVEQAVNGAQGVTTRPNTATVNPRPNRPYVAVSEVAVAVGTYPTTLVHELCHVLTGSGDHSVDANNLMADGNIRNGVNQLTFGQIAMIHRSPFAI